MYLNFGTTNVAPITTKEGGLSTKRCIDISQECIEKGYANAETNVNKNIVRKRVTTNAMFANMVNKSALGNY